MESVKGGFGHLQASLLKKPTNCCYVNFVCECFKAVYPPEGMSLDELELYEAWTCFSMKEIIV